VLSSTYVAVAYSTALFESHIAGYQLHNRPGATKFSPPFEEQRGTCVSVDARDSPCVSPASREHGATCWCQIAGEVGGGEGGGPRESSLFAL
jgi:hypothetical protein